MTNHFCGLAAALLFTTSANAQLYSNGSLDSGPLTESGLQAPAGYRWSELQHDTGAFTYANAVTGWSGHITVSDGRWRLADDFVVPNGFSWTITSVQLYAYETNATAFFTPRFNIRIWRNGRPNAPGSILACDSNDYVEPSATEDSLFFRLSNTVVPAPGTPPGTTRKILRFTIPIPAACASAGFFTPGTYWIDWQSIVGDGRNHYYPSNVYPGSRSRVGDNAIQKGPFDSAAWIEIADFAGSDGSAPPAAVDFPFVLVGSASDRIFRNGFGGSP